MLLLTDLRGGVCEAIRQWGTEVGEGEHRFKASFYRVIQIDSNREYKRKKRKSSDTTDHSYLSQKRSTSCAPPAPT